MGDLQAPVEASIRSAAALQPPPASIESLEQLETAVVGCNRCPRLRTYCEQVAREKRRAYRDQAYWGRPVPSFGDPEARVLLLGLAPGAHGSNRTGRPFTGDGSGGFLFPLLHEAGYASQPHAVSRHDGMRLHDAWISAVVRCAPPGNQPSPGELAACSPYLDQEMRLLSRLRVVIALGKIAFDGFTSHLVRTGQIDRRTGMVFSHGAEYAIPGHRMLLATYHPSLQNTNTGRLTAAMFLAILGRARALSERALPERAK
ncbi:MAG TPA: uracil-DNA glycosylase [Acidobacteriaceae bacterium]